MEDFLVLCTIVGEDLDSFDKSKVKVKNCKVKNIGCIWQMEWIKRIPCISDAN